MKVDIEKIYFILEQKKFELEDEKVRYGKYTPLLDAQMDMVNDICAEIEQTFKYTRDHVVSNAPAKKVPKRK